MDATVHSIAEYTAHHRWGDTMDTTVHSLAGYTAHHRWGDTMDATAHSDTDTVSTVYTVTLIAISTSLFLWGFNHVLH